MFEEVRTIITPEEARKAVCLDEKSQKIKLRRDGEIKNNRRTRQQIALNSRTVLGGQ